MVSKMRIIEQKEEGDIGTEALNIIENYPNFLKRAITCHKSWFFTYDTETHGLKEPNFQLHRQLKNLEGTCQN